MPTHESEQRRRLSPPAARAAPPALPRPFPQPDPSPQSPSSVTSLCRVLACKVGASRKLDLCMHPNQHGRVFVGLSPQVDLHRRSLGADADGVPPVLVQRLGT